MAASCFYGEFLYYNQLPIFNFFHSRDRIIQKTIISFHQKSVEYGVFPVNASSQNRAKPNISTKVYATNDANTGKVIPYVSHSAGCRQDNNAQFVDVMLFGSYTQTAVRNETLEPKTD